MSYKETLANFITLEHAARLVQEHANISVEEARENIVFAVQDYKLRGRARDTRALDRGYHYNSDALYDALVRSLSPHNIDWGNSSVPFRYGGFRQYELEVLRRDLETLWPSPCVDSIPIITPSTLEPHPIIEVVPADLPRLDDAARAEIIVWLDKEYRPTAESKKRDAAIKAMRTQFRTKYNFDNYDLLKCWDCRNKEKWPKYGGQKKNK